MGNHQEIKPRHIFSTQKLIWYFLFHSITMFALKNDKFSNEFLSQQIDNDIIYTSSVGSSLTRHFSNRLSFQRIESNCSICRPFYILWTGNWKEEISKLVNWKLKIEKNRLEIESRKYSRKCSWCTSSSRNPDAPRAKSNRNPSTSHICYCPGNRPPRQWHSPRALQHIAGCRWDGNDPHRPALILGGWLCRSFVH